MKRSHSRILTRLAIVAVLYPWLVSYDSVDSASHTISIYGSGGSYTHVTRDCNGNLTSVLPVPFAEAAASYEAPIGNELGYKIHGGYLHSLYGYNIIDPNSPNDTAIQNIEYAGASLELNRPFWGADIGMIGFNKQTWLSDFGPNKPYALTAGIRVGYLDTWYLTGSLLNSDPLVGSKPYGTFGVGFSLGRRMSTDSLRTEPAHAWFGIGLGPPFEYTGVGSFLLQPTYDGVLAGELSVPFNQWTLALRGGYDPSGHGGGYMSGGLSYGF